MPRALIRTSFLALLTTIAASAQGESDPPARVGEFLKIDRLAEFRQVQKVGSFSSYDRSGGNDDGFSGKDSFLRKEGDNGLVIAELQGPGAITRFWTPTPTDDPIEFYFDGEDTPRITMPFSHVFHGTTGPFLGPLVYEGVGGHVSYVPLEFEKSIKVIIRAPKVMFYQLNYVLYEPGTEAASFEMGGGALAATHAMEGLEGLLPRETPARAVDSKQVLQPGQSITLFETSEAGRIESLQIGPVDALGGPDRAVVLRIYWDGASTPAVEVPAIDFFGGYFGDPAMRSLLIGVDNGVGFARLPMPFASSARVELALEREGGAPVSVESRITVSDKGKHPGEGFFHAVWRRENPTTPGQPFTFLDVEGRGHVVGATIQVQGTTPGNTFYFEGDDEATIDGETTVRGTGSEDFFNGGWYDLPGRWYARKSFPLSGCLGYDKPLSRTGGFRLLLADAYPFERSLRLTIEHGGDHNAEAGDYTGVTYFYLDRSAQVGPPLPDLASRQVSPRDVIVLVPGYQAPIHAFSLDHTVLSRVDQTFGDRNERVLRVRLANSKQVEGHYVAFDAPVLEPGTYAISVEAATGPDEGIIRLLDQDQQVGEAIDLYAPEPALSGERFLANLTLPAGGAPLYIAMVGKNPASTGQGFTLVRIKCERLK